MLNHVNTALAAINVHLAAFSAPFLAPFRPSVLLGDDLHRTKSTARFKPRRSAEQLVFAGSIARTRASETGATYCNCMIYLPSEMRSSLSIIRSLRD